MMILAKRLFLGWVLTGMLACGEARSSGPNDPKLQSGEAFLTPAECEEVLTKTEGLIAAHYGWETFAERRTADEGTAEEDTVVMTEYRDEMTQWCVGGELYKREDLDCIRRAASLESFSACQQQAENRESQVLFQICLSKAKDSIAEGRCYRMRASGNLWLHRDSIRQAP